MSGPKRNPDALNTIGVVVVGICGAVLVYVSIIALQAFYMNDSSEVQTMADYGGQDTAHMSLRATQTNVIEDCAPNAKPEAGKQQTYRIPIKYAIKKVAEEAKKDASNLVPAVGRSDKGTIQPIFGRPKVSGTQAPQQGNPSGGAPAGDPTQPVAPGTQLTPTGGQGPGGGQPPGQSPAPSPAGPPTGTGAADPNPTGAQTPSPGGQNPGTGGATTEPRRPGSTPGDAKGGGTGGGGTGGGATKPPAGGNTPTPQPKAGATDPKSGTAKPGPSTGAGATTQPKPAGPAGGGGATTQPKAGAGTAAQPKK